jgi:hypothetical protein
MASSRPWPFDDDDRPSGSVRPLNQADLQAILAHLSDDHDELLAGTGADRPVVAVRVRPAWAARVAPPRRDGGRTGGRVGDLDPDPALASGRHPRDRCRRRSPRQPAGAQVEPGPRRAGDRGGRLGAAVPAQPRGRRLAARSGRGATHRPTAVPTGAARLGGPARPGPPRGAGPTSTAMIPGAAAAVRSDPNFDRPDALRVDLSTGVVAAAGC